jgi:hypothetical protein
MSSLMPGRFGLQQNDIPEEAAKQSQHLARTSSKDIAQLLVTLRDTAKEKAAGRHSTVARMRNLYLSRFDWQGKAVWQSKAPIPRLFSLLENWASIYAGALMPNARWFQVQDKWGMGDARAVQIERIQRANISDAGLYGLVRPMLLTGGIGGFAPIKVGVDSSGDLPKPAIDLWDPLDVYLDWTGRSRFLIAESEVDPYMLREWAEQGMFSESAVDRAIKEGNTNPDATSGEKETRTLKWTEFWGDLVEKDGECLMRNCTAVMIGDRTIIRRPIENPFLDKSSPFVLVQPLRVPFLTYSPGLAEHVSGLVRMLTELANAVMDEALFSSVQAYMYDVDRVRPQDLVRGIYPGKAIGVENLAEGPGMERLQLGGVSSDAMGVMQYLDNETQRDVSVVESMTGVPTPGSRRKTAREAVSNQNAAMGLTRAMARDLEITALEPILDKVLSVFAQVTTKDKRAFFTPEMLEILGPQGAIYMAALDYEARAIMVTRGVVHKATGISGAQSMNEDLNHLMALAEAFHRSPDMWANVNVRKLQEKLAELHRLAPDDVLLTEAEVAAKQQAQMQQMAMAQAQAQAQLAGAGVPGGGPPGPGTGVPPQPPGPGASLQGPPARNTLIPPRRPMPMGSPRSIPRLSPNVVVGGQ